MQLTPFTAVTGMYSRGAGFPGLRPESQFGIAKRDERETYQQPHWLTGQHHGMGQSRASAHQTPRTCASYQGHMAHGHAKSSHSDAPTPPEEERICPDGLRTSFGHPGHPLDVQDFQWSENSVSASQAAGAPLRIVKPDDCDPWAAPSCCCTDGYLTEKGADGSYTRLWSYLVVADWRSLPPCQCCCPSHASDCYFRGRLRSQDESALDRSCCVRC